MKIIFLGTGEAADENNPNNSSLVVSEKTNLLLDCGFTTPYQLWKYNNDQSLLDGVYITHLHGDHYFGLPILLVRMWEEGRTKPLTVICQKGAGEIIKKIMDMAYSGFRKKLKYEINFVEVGSGEEIKLNDLKLSFALGKHSTDVLAIKVENDEKSLCYSGDGMFTEESKRVYKGSGLVIQETYLYDEEKVDHASIVSAVKMAEENDIKCLALTHINRDVRKNLKKVSSNKVKIIIPQPFEEYQL